MYAAVKYSSDSSVSVVPITHVKNFKFPLDVSKSYQVFWSSNPEEKPNLSHKKMDKIYKIQGNKKYKESSPPNGYYSAKILCIADTFLEAEESLNALGLSLQKQSVEKMSKAETSKLISSAASSVVRESLLQNSLIFSDDVDVSDDTDADETVEPVRYYKETVKCLESKNSMLEKEVETLKAELMVAKEQLKESKDETKNVLEKLKQTKEKYRKVKDEFATVRYLNNELQRKFIDSIAVSSYLNESNYDTHIASQREKSPSLISNVPKLKRSCISLDQCEEQSLPKISRLSEASNIVEETPDLLQIEPEADVSALEDGGFFLTDALIQSSAVGCRNGKDGDKVYVKNLAINLFGKNVLINSSATGRKPPTGEKPGRPALPKAGVGYIKNLLEQRVLREIHPRNDLTQDDKRLIVNQRSSFVIVHQAIGDKIATLRRVNKKCT